MYRNIIFNQIPVSRVKCITSMIKKLIPTVLEVKFIGYCPHPAEVLVEDGNIRKVIHRIYLFQKNGKGIEQVRVRGNY